MAALVALILKWDDLQGGRLQPGFKPDDGTQNGPANIVPFVFVQKAARQWRQAIVQYGCRRVWVTCGINIIFMADGVEQKRQIPADDLLKLNRADADIVVALLVWGVIAQAVKQCGQQVAARTLAGGAHASLPSEVLKVQVDKSSRLISPRLVSHTL